MNYPATHPPLRNRYFALRHGESTANVAQLIVSQPAHGLADYGLTPRGRQQVAERLQPSSPFSGHRLVIYSSDFARTRQTAAIAASLLNVPEVSCSPLLRERDFGDWELGSVTAYRTVWTADAANPDYIQRGVESVNHVLERTTQLIRQLERQHVDHDIILVSHGDPLHIMQTAFLNLPPSQHCSLPPLQNAELRLLGGSQQVSA